MSETAGAASRRRVHRVARSSRAHLLVEVVKTISQPAIDRDVQDSLVLKETAAQRRIVLHGATLRHAAAPFHAASLAGSFTEVHVVATDETARVLEEGFL